MKRPWILQKKDSGLSTGKRWVFWIWNLFWIIAAGLFAGWLSLIYAYGSYGDEMWESYFENSTIVVLNFLPAVVVVLLAFFLAGRAWLGFLLGGGTVLGLSLGNYYMLRFRDDPLMFEDLKHIREGGEITATMSYDLTPDDRIWFGILCFLGVTLLLFLLARGVPPLEERILLLVAGLALCVPLSAPYTDQEVYNVDTKNGEEINVWSQTERFFSRGFLYPFLHSVSADRLQAPEGYWEGTAAEKLNRYQDAKIPEEKKVDLVSIQLEAFADFSRFQNVEGIDWEKAYGLYHEIEAESVSGNLVTNIFAGGTVDSERAFLTGFADQWNFRGNTNSYAWYLRSQGYAVEGSHPGNEWFYNRKNVNRSLGIPEYYFCENHYEKLHGDEGIAPDRELFPEIFRLYQKNRDGEGKPYFSFNVSYQGHGPYDTETVWRRSHFTDGRYSPETTNIVDNYLGSLLDTAQQLRNLMDQFQQEERPVVLVAWGDHKPWFGDGNSAYKELGVNLDPSTQEGFYNYYATRYFIWANDAAKEVLGQDFVGEGPDVSTCFLMNEVFALCGWEGSAWTQATDEIRETLPVLTVVDGYVEKDQGFVQTPQGAGAQALRDYQSLAYYYGSHFAYPEVLSEE